MQTAIVNPNPRDRFRSEKRWVEDHHRLIQDPAFVRAMDFVQLEYSRLLSRQNEQQAASTGLKLQGAIEFQNLFKEFAEERPKAPPVRDTDNLRPTDQPKRQ